MEYGSDWADSGCCEGAEGCAEYWFGALYWLFFYIPGLTRSSQEIFKMLPYLVTLLVLIMVALRRKREDQPPHSLGVAYFREER